MKKTLFAALFLYLANFAGGVPAQPGTPDAGLVNATCAENAYWSSSVAGGACVASGGLGQRSLLVNDYADSGSDILRFYVCDVDSCSTTDLTASATAINDVSVTVVSYNDCDDDVITVTAVDNWGDTKVVTLTEAIDWDEDTDEATTAGHLCTAINGIAGVSGTLSTATCIMSKFSTYQSLSVATSNPTCATVTNHADANIDCSKSNISCANQLHRTVDAMLGAGTLSGFVTTTTNPSLSDAKIGFTPLSTTVEFDVTVVNSAADPFGVLTSSNDGSFKIVKPALMYGEIRFCGNGSATTASPQYISPILPSDTGTDHTFGSAACDANDNTTEATADLPWHAGFAIKPVSMTCTLDCGAETGDTITFSLRSAEAAADADLTCSFLYLATPNQCSVLDPSPSTIARGATIAIKVATNGTDDCSAGDVECIVGYTY